MKIKKPNFWDYKKPNFIAYLILPLTLITSLINTFKRTKTPESRNIKTICIGNIYIGGTGKTPTAIKISKIISDLKLKPVFIKKYYKDSIDEQKLLNKHGDLICEYKRLNALNKAVKNNFDVAIFDDGLQDPSINYDLKIVCFNIKNFIGNQLLIPAGPLREKINSLCNYDIVFLNGNNENTEQIINEIKINNNKIKIFESIYNLINSDLLDKKLKYLAFAGIGNPKTFNKTLLKDNFNIVKFLEYPDHYQYTSKDITKIKNIAKILNAKIITTEKDYLRIASENNSDINFIKMQLNIKNEKDLINLLKFYI